MLALCETVALFACKLLYRSARVSSGFERPSEAAWEFRNGKQQLSMLSSPLDIPYNMSIRTLFTNWCLW